MLHLVWPLAQSLSSMVVATRSQNSSWHSLWDLRDTQAPQLRQSNNTLGGNTVSVVMQSRLMLPAPVRQHQQSRNRHAVVPTVHSMGSGVVAAASVTM